MYEIAFVVEQILGHVTHGENLRQHVPHDPDVHPHWVYPTYEVEGAARRVPMYRSNWSLRCGLRTRRMLRATRRTADLDAIFFHTQVPATLSPDHVRRTPSVVSLDATPLQYDELGSHYAHVAGPVALERLKRRGAESTFRAAKHLVTWSEWTKQGLIDDYSVEPDKITVVPPGVGVADWRRPEPRRINSDRPTRLLFVGGDLERKGGLLLLEAFRVLRPLGLELHIVTRDEVPLEDGVIVHRGLTSNSAELKQLYHDCDIFVLPTFADCLPMVLSEAGAAGMAAVSTTVAAIPEVVLDGRTGLLTRPGDVAALTEAIRELTIHPEWRLEMGEHATQHVARNYDTANNTAQLLAILKRVADAEGDTA